ncbi:ipa4 [Escherichia coli M863]|nr:ipa4 [Escherichia coli M863]
MKAYIYNRACNRASALELELANLMLTSLPELPAGLEKLDVSGNQLCSLPVLPTGLEELYVRRNLLDSLPVLPAGLKHLYVCKTSCAACRCCPPVWRSLM